MMFLPGTGLAFLAIWATTGKFEGLMGLPAWMFLIMSIVEVGVILYFIAITIKHKGEKTNDKSNA